MTDRAPFGRTGHQSSRVIFGAAALGSMRQEHADQILATLLEFGVNHIDTAASYGDSELRIAPWMAEHRGRFFLATKTAERTGDAARAGLERSLTRPGGAVEALSRARDEGLARFIGVTGHGLRIAGMHLRSLERFDFDSVLLPYNYAVMSDDRYRADVEALLGVCAQRGVAVQTIKSVARRRWPGGPGRQFSWYEPLTDGEALARAVRYVLGRTGLFLNSSSDARLLRPILETAVADGPVPADEEMAADIERHEIEPLFDGAALERI